jgi:hypothetical protein
MGKSDLVQKVGEPIHCCSRGPKSWGTGLPGPHGGCAHVQELSLDFLLGFTPAL